VSVAAVLTLERDGKPVPLARTHQPAVLRVVADAVLVELESAAAGESDELLAALTRQELARVRQAFGLLGLTPLAEEAR
jgi:hypothetical protein